MVLVSLGLHYLSLHSLPEQPQSVRPVTDGVSSIDFQFEAPPAAIEPFASPQAPSAAATPTPPVATPQKVRVRMPRAAHGPAPIAAQQPATTTAPAAEASPADGRPASPTVPAPSATALSARAAALSLFEHSGVEVPPSSLAERRGAQLSAELYAAANAAPFPRRGAPKLRHDADGTCHFDGSTIDATIAADGTVKFADKSPRVAVSGPLEPPGHPATPEQALAPRRLELNFKLSGGTEAERSWFLRETQDLRRELADAAHDGELRRTQHALLVRLDHIWCDSTKSAAQRRRMLFERWDDTSPDETGGLGREVVIDFIQRNLPAQSALAYSNDELAALNRLRQQRARFEPYAIHAAGAAAGGESEPSRAD